MEKTRKTEMKIQILESMLSARGITSARRSRDVKRLPVYRRFLQDALPAKCLWEVNHYVR